MIPILIYALSAIISLAMYVLIGYLVGNDLEVKTFIEMVATSLVPAFNIVVVIIGIYYYWSVMPEFIVLKGRKKDTKCQ